MTVFSVFRIATSALLRPKAKAPPSLGRPHASQINFSSSSIAAKRSLSREIPYAVVRLVDPESGQLNPPVALKDILPTFNRKEQFLQLVSEHPEPIVKLFNTKDVFAKEKERRAKAIAGRRTTIQKEIQLTWAVAPGDLEHKLKKVRMELERGYRIDLVYAPKTGAPMANPREMWRRVQETVDSLADIAEEWKPRDISRSITVIYLKAKKKMINLFHTLSTFAGYANHSPWLPSTT